MKYPSRATRTLFVLTAVGMFLVLLAGALVTKTESGMGCGDDWPLCNGKFVPAATIESGLEYSHRVTSGLVGILVLASFIVTVRRYRARKDALLYASSSLFFTVLQALLGAAAVKWEQSSLVMALHFGFSLLAFAGTLLLAITVYRIDRPIHPSGWGEAFPYSGQVSPLFRWLTWGILVYSYVVVYLGAYIRHTDSAAGCRGWPLCSGEVIPSDFSGMTGIAFTHRVAAAVYLVLILWMAHLAYHHYKHMPVIRKSGLAVLGLTFAQILSGAWVANTLGSEEMHLYSSLTHTVIIAVLFGVLCYLSILVWQLGGRRHVS